MDSPEINESEALDLPAEVDHRSYRNPARKAEHRPGYTEEQKTLALAVYAETGSVQTAADQSHIPRNTIKYWIENDPDIDAKFDVLRRAVREKAAHLYAEIAVRSAEELLDRVNNGDYHTDKEGKVTRRQMPGRELAFVSSLAADKHALITAAVVKQRGEDSSLTKLAEGLISALDKRALRSKADAAVPQGSEPNSAD